MTMMTLVLRGFGCIMARVYLYYWEEFKTGLYLEKLVILTHQNPKRDVLQPLNLPIGYIRITSSRSSILYLSPASMGTMILISPSCAVSIRRWVVYRKMALAHPLWRTEPVAIMFTRLMRESIIPMMRILKITQICVSRSVIK